MVKQLPTCLALVFSDDIYVCPTTGKRTILGTFSTIFGQSFPTKINVCVYLSFTDGMGESDIIVRLVLLSNRALEDEVILTAHGKVNFDDPRIVLEVHMVFRQLELPAAGEYRFQVVAPDGEGGEELLLERRLVAVAPESENENELENKDE